MGVESGLGVDSGVGVDSCGVVAGAALFGCFPAAFATAASDGFAADLGV